MTVDALLQSTARLAPFPRLGRVGTVDDTRELVFDRSFIIVYRTHEEHALVEIIAIAHAKRER
jgi:plasmid stabilization system protein ParE